VKLQNKQAWRTNLKHEAHGAPKSWRMRATAYHIHNIFQAGNRLLPVLTSREVILFKIQRAHKDMQCTYSGNLAFALYAAL
jgi:hypothetical protein